MGVLALLESELSVELSAHFSVISQFWGSRDGAVRVFFQPF